MLCDILCSKEKETEKVVFIHTNNTNIDQEQLKRKENT